MHMPSEEYTIPALVTRIPNKRYPDICVTKHKSKPLQSSSANVLLPCFKTTTGNVCNRRAVDV